ncbi:MAG: hypothetical protein HKL98_12540 [Burkholderiales bacterium]|nr:hypothetical protein [Burkholderiales bacterium]
MELDWSTFLLEIVNCLILIWILKRFLYRPVLEAVASRRREVEETLSAAKGLKEEALGEKRENLRLLQEWENRRQILEAELATEIGEMRKKRLEELDSDLEKERAKRLAQEDRRTSEWMRNAENGALEAATKFASRLLARFASSDLESMICNAFLEELAGLDAGPIREMLASRTELLVSVSSAFPLSQKCRDQIVKSISMLAGRELQGTFHEDPEIVCGLRARIGPWVMEANLVEELAFFREAAKNGG